MINEKGYLRPTYEELLERRIEQAKALWGDDVDTSNSSPLGKFIRLAVQDLADAFEVQERLYYGRYPHTATGHDLDRLMPFANITRNAATRAEHRIIFQGEPYYTIPAGFLVGTKGDETFYLVNPLELDYGGVGFGIVQCTEFGAIGNVQLGSITEIINPDANVLMITHENIETIGEDGEADADLRKRFDIAIEGSSSGTALAIRGAVMRVNGVKSCVVVENDTDGSVNGIPPHCFETFVHAPETLSDEIASAIFSKKPIGIMAHGTTRGVAILPDYTARAVSFSYVSVKNLCINVNVATNSDFELDGVEQIKTALLGYVNSLKAGEDVIYTSIYKYLFSIAGVKDVPQLTLSTDGSSYSTWNVIAGQNEVIVLSAANVKVEVSEYADK